MRTKTLAVALALLFLLQSCPVTQGLTENYDNSKTLSDAITLFYSVSTASSYAKLALVYSGSTGKVRWLGFGIGERASGSMLGADVVTFDIADDGSCSSVDRYVPFVPYPLLVDPIPFPIPDNKTTSDWNVTACKKSSEEIVVEFGRPLGVDNSGQDREIIPGTNVVIWAYGDSFGYHGGARGNSEVVFFETDGRAPLPQGRPADATVSQDLVFKDVEIVAKRTDYVCGSFTLDLDGADTRHIVYVEPMVTPGNEKYVHHLVVHVCKKAGYFAQFTTPASCVEVSPQGHPECSSVLYGWAVGGNPLRFPDIAGFPVDSDQRYVIIELHYNNVDLDQGTLDSSGVRVWFADRMRDVDAGSVFVGDPLVSFGLVFEGSEVVDREPVETCRRYSGSCPSACTEQFSETVKVFATFPHMHTTGRKIYTNRFDKNGNFLETISAVNFWSNDNQRVFELDSELDPGDSIVTTCLFDTTKAPRTFFGLETKDEMCMELLMIYPVQRNRNGEAIGFCGYLSPDLTVCGPSTDATIEVPNPNINDTVGNVDVFAAGTHQCDQLAQVGTSPTPNPTEEPSASPNSSNDVCFPAAAALEMADGSTKTMRELSVGDSVRTGQTTFSQVYFFGHRDELTKHQFTKIEFAGEYDALVLSEGHLVFLCDGRAIPAREVQVGDYLVHSSGSNIAVSSVSQVVSKGLFNPHTMDGRLVVNGVQVSSYTEVMPAIIAHWLLSPERVAFRLGLTLLGSRFELGRPRLAQLVVTVKRLLL